jgi:hypothetical protein
MARNVAVSLEWKGPFQDAANVTGKAGIYMVIAGKETADGKQWDTSTYKLLDIGQSGDAATRLADHDREECWKRNKPADSTLLFKFAPMPSDQYDETDRRIVECSLRASHRPLPCGTECNEGYNRMDSVRITNKGQCRPLRDNYACR